MIIIPVSSFKHQNVHDLIYTAETDPALRLAYVAAFSSTCYASSSDSQRYGMISSCVVCVVLIAGDVMYYGGMKAI